MSEPQHLTEAPEQEGMPSGIPYIVGNEAAERFSFYGMKAVLTVFMTKFLVDATGQSDVMTPEKSAEWVHTFVAAAYFFPILGAVLSDWLLGKYRTILWLSILYCIGHGVLALMEVEGLGIDQRTILFWGLALIAVGSGGIKPCVSAHVGDQFGKKNASLLPVVFGWFYFSINFGSFLSMLLTPYLRDKYGPGVAFGVPGVLMAIATFVFWLGRNHFVHVPPSGNKFWDQTFSKEGVKAMFNLIPLYVFVAMFWSLFDQTSSRWVSQAEHMDRELFGITMTSDQMQAVNPILVLILIPIFSLYIYPAINAVFKLTPLRKIGIGMFVVLPAFMIPAWLETQINAGAEPSIGWQVLAYLFITAAEVMISITCLEFSYTQAPKEMKSFIMGLYLLSVAAGNIFAARVNSFISSKEEAGTPVLEGADYYWFFTACMAGMSILFVIWSQFYKGASYVKSEEEGDVSSGD